MKPAVVFYLVMVILAGVSLPVIAGVELSKEEMKSIMGRSGGCTCNGLAEDDQTCQGSSDGCTSCSSTAILSGVVPNPTCQSPVKEYTNLSLNKCDVGTALACDVNAGTQKKCYHQRSCIAHAVVNNKVCSEGLNQSCTVAPPAGWAAKCRTCSRGNFVQNSTRYKFDDKCNTAAP